MNLIKRIYSNVEPEIKRFPGVVISTVISAVCLFFLRASYAVSLDDDHFLSVMTKSSMWSVAFLILVSFITEFILKTQTDEKKARKISHIVQLASLFVCYVPMYFFFRLKNIYFWNFYICSILAMLTMAFFFAGKIKKEEDVVPGFVSAFIISLIIFLCVLAGLFLILWAVDRLLFHFDSDYFIGVTAGCFFVVFVNCTLAFATRKESSEQIAKPFRVIVKTLLFSLYIILIFIIYAYLIKSLFTKTIPSGIINWIVSFASAFYLFFHLCLKNYTGDKVVSFFYRHGHLILIPLIAVQCIAAGIRINAYGLTYLRYESLLYIIFSIIVCILASFKNGEYIKYVYPSAAVILMLASITPLNLEDVPRRNQIYRVEQIYKAHGMYKDHELISQNAETVFTDEEKEIICGAYGYLVRDSVSPKWKNWNPDENSFEDFFGFRFLNNYENFARCIKSIQISFNDEYVLDVKNYSSLATISSTRLDENNRIFITDIQNNTYEVTQFLEKYINDDTNDVREHYENPFVWEISDGIYAIVSAVDLNIEKDVTSYGKILGYIAK